MVNDDITQKKLDLLISSVIRMEDQLHDILVILDSLKSETIEPPSGFTTGQWETVLKHIQSESDDDEHDDG